MLHHIHTACKNCVFATWDMTGKTQLDCHLNKITTFKNNGIEILEVYDEKDNEFYIINEAKCYFYRDKSFMQGSPLDEIKQHVIDNTNIVYQIIIFSNNNIKDTEKTLLSALNQIHKPTHIAIIRRFMDKFLPTEYISLLQSYEKLIPLWRLQNVVDINLTDLQAIDLVIDFEPMPIYGVFQSGLVIPSDLFSSLNKIMINLEKAIVAVISSTDSGFITQLSIHRRLNGNAEKPLIDKLKENVGLPELLVPITEICPTFPV